MLLGLTIIVGGFLIYRVYSMKILLGLLLLTGIGALGVGLFPETTGILHHIVSLIAFLFGGLSAILAYRIEKSPMNYFSVILGAVTLISLGLYISGIFLGLGSGGMERMIVYPLVLWGIGLGGHLMQTPKGT